MLNKTHYGKKALVLFLSFALFFPATEAFSASPIRTGSEKALFHALKKKPKTLILLAGKNRSFRLPKGLHDTEIILRTKPSVKKVRLTIAGETSLRSLVVDTEKKVDLAVKGNLSSLRFKQKNTGARIRLSGRIGEISSILLEAPVKLQFRNDSTKAEGSATVYVKAESALSVTGKGKNRPSVFIFQDANSSALRASTAIRLFAEGSASLLMQKGAEASSLTTLRYKTSLTLKNNTADILTVQTPSGEKTVQIGEERTLSGK